MIYTGWRTLGGNTYYFQMGAHAKGQDVYRLAHDERQKSTTSRGNADGNIGKMYTGWRTIDGNKYFFERTGAYGVKE